MAEGTWKRRLNAFVQKSCHWSPARGLLNGRAKDSVILDFEWFANTSDYAFSDEGEVWYDDFAWNPKIFPEPTAQLEAYLKAGACWSFLDDLGRGSRCTWGASANHAWATESFYSWRSSGAGSLRKVAPRPMRKGAGCDSRMLRCRAGIPTR